ncbi:RNA polymerase sigma factor [Pedobacter deserti]|uniref:RNA polymerase sigma factor n=1 Tax=Pedobacter deserti TaxID=2817382 RepID=UPI00210C5675|nr:RNA polymerase sigma-70 factor [Pedobacter sp. SYSU D00382]
MPLPLLRSKIFFILRTYSVNLPIKNYSSYSEQQLISLWQHGNDHVFEAFYQKHAVKLLKIAVHKTGDRNVAEELVQDSFLSLYRHKADITEQSHIGAYLYIALKNRILNYYRKENTHKKYEAYVKQHTREQDSSTELTIDTRDLELRIIEEIEKLPSQCKTVFRLSRFEYLSDKEIAARLNISVNTVEQHKRKALRILRGSLQEYLTLAFVVHLLEL